MGMGFGGGTRTAPQGPAHCARADSIAVTLKPPANSSTAARANKNFIGQLRLRGDLPRRESPGIAHPQATPTRVSVWLTQCCRGAGQRGQTYLMELSGLPRPSFG